MFHKFRSHDVCKALKYHKIGKLFHLLFCIVQNGCYIYLHGGQNMAGTTDLAPSYSSFIIFNMLCVYIANLKGIIFYYVLSLLSYAFVGSFHKEWHLEILMGGGAYDHDS